MHWISFVQSDGLTRSLIHLFPSLRGGFSAQPVQCTIEIFADRNEATTIALDGIQLNQPDGARIDEIFPHLKQGGNPIFGIVVTLDADSKRSDLSCSQTSIEISSRNRAVRFPMARGGERLQRAKPIPLVFDKFTTTSLIVTNPSERYAELRLNLGADVGSAAEARVLNLSIAPRSVSEFPLSRDHNRGKEPFSTMSGAVEFDIAELVDTLPYDIVAFVVFRDATSKSISSVIEV